MPGGYAFPSITVEVGFQDAPYANPASVTWSDISAYTESIQTSLGRVHELQQVSPSTATLALSNEPASRNDTTGGRFSPWNTSSEFYYSGSGLTPGHPVRITAKWQNVTYPIFYGVTKAFVPSYGSSRSTMTLQCYDLLALLNLDTLDAGGYNLFPVANADAFYPLSDPPLSNTCVDLTTHGNTATVIGAATFGVAGPFITQTSTAASVSGFSSAIKTPATSSGASVSVDCWVNVPNAPSSGDFTFALLGNVVGLGVGTNGHAYAAYNFNVANSTVNICDGAWHYLAAVQAASVCSVYVDGELAGSVSDSGASVSSAANYIGTGLMEIANVGFYSAALSAAEIADQHQIGPAGFLVQDSGARVAAVLNEVGVPAALQNIDTGKITCQGATSSLSTTTAMAYLNTVVNTERGLLYQDTTGVIQFKNRHHVYTASTSTVSQGSFGYATGSVHYLSSSFVPGEDDLDLWNNIPVQRINGQIMTASDATSQASYGRRTLTGYTNLLFDNDIDSADLAGGLLYQYKQPAPRVRAITLNSSISAGAGLPQMLGRQLLDRITIVWRPMDGSNVDFSQQSLIEQIAHTVTPEVWTTTFAVSPIGTEHFFILGTDKLGTGILGF